MKVGSLGDVAFTVSAKKWQTYENMEYKTEAKYATHSRHMKKGLLELTGFEPDTLSFDMTLSAFFGINPYKTLKKLEQMKNKGKVVKLVIGKKVIGKKWVVTDISEKFGYTYKDGTVISFDVNVNLKEYAT